MMKAVATKLRNEAPNLELVATLKPFPQEESIESESNPFAVIQTEDSGRNHLDASSASFGLPSQMLINSYSA